MSDVQVTWRGKEILAALRGASPDALFAAGELLIDTAAAKAPRQSGDLAESGYVTSAERSTYKSGTNYHKEIKAKPGEVIAAFAAFYAKFVERGTKFASAHPYFRPALDESKGAMLNLFASRLGKVLK